MLIAILVIGALFRFIRLDYAPSGGHGDVSWIGINALDWVDRGIWQFYIRELYSPEFFPVYLTGLLINPLGISYMPQRIITAVAGVLFVALLYPAAYWLIGDDRPHAFRVRAGLFAALAGAVSLHVVAINRLGMESPPFLTVVTLMTALTAWAWRRGGWWRWALAGAALALAQYVYLPARLLPVVLALWIAHAWWADRAPLRGQLRGWLVMAAVSFALTLPAIILFIRTPEAFSARADAGTAATGGWIWNFDTSQYGGIIGLTLQNLWLQAQAFGVRFEGAYTIMNLPLMSPVFFAGFLISLVLLIRAPRQIATAWCALAIPPLLFTDLISGAYVELHALHQMGILPFVYLLSGIGLAALWEGLPRQRMLRTLGGASLVIALLLPSVAGMAAYLGEVIPGEYTDPRSSWHRAQTDVDIARRITSDPAASYLLPYSEYARPDIGWLVAAGYRERRSAVSGEGLLAISDPPAALTILYPTAPERPRHDGYPSRPDPRLWVLLHEGTVWLLPPLTDAQVEDVRETTLGARAGVTVETMIDRSNTQIATLYTLETPDDLFAPRSVIETPLDEVFEGRMRLVGYTLPTGDLTPGSIIYATLYWQTIEPAGEDYEVFAQLWDDAGTAIARAHDFPYSGMYRSRIWRMDEIVPTHHWLALPDVLPVGRYTLIMGLFRQLENERVPVVGMASDSAERIVRQPILRVTPEPITTDLPEPPSPTVFGDLRMSGLATWVDGAQSSNSPLRVTPGQTITLDIVWQSDAPLARDYNLFVHLSTALDAPPSAQLDAPIGGGLPTSVWRAGERYRDTLNLALPVNLAPGSYTLSVGVYDWSTGERLPMPDGADRYVMGEVTVSGSP